MGSFGRSMLASLALAGLALAAGCEARSGGITFHKAHRRDDSGALDSGDSSAGDDTAPDDSVGPDTGPALSTDTGGGANPQGVDVSHWDYEVDWGAVYADGVSFMWAKATEGTGFEDPNFVANTRGARDAGLYVGAYHFAVPSDSDAVTQADYFVQHGGDWSADGQTLPGALDIEWNPYDGGDCYGMSVGEMTAWIREFVDEYAALTGRTPIIYCGQLWWSECVDDSDFSDAPLWVASWDDAVPELPAGWDDWDVWQYGAASVAGIPVDADVNVYNGSEARLQELADGG